MGKSFHLQYLRRETRKVSVREGGEEPDRCRIRTLGWENLSLEVLSAIGKCLKSRIEICKFRSVCRKWRSSLPLPLNPNLLINFLPQKIPIFDAKLLPFNEKSLHLVAVSVILVQPLELNSNLNGWILKVEERQPGKLLLLYPLSGDPILNLSPNFCKSLNLLKFRVSEISRGYRFCACSGSTYERKVVLCPNSAPISPNFEDFTALVLYSGGFLVALSIRNNILEEVRELVRESEGSWCKDVICFKGSFYAVGGGGKLCAIDHVSLKLTDIVADLICEDFCAIQLVESCQGLLLVVKNKSRVYKFNDIQHKWEAVETLGNKIMFLDTDLCFLVSTQDIFQSKGDFVVFSSVFFFRSAEYIVMTENHWIYIFCLDHGGKNDSQLKASKLSYQSITRLLWPPPTWFYAWDSEDVEVQPYVSIQHCSHRAKEASISFKVLEAWEQAVVVSPLNPCNCDVGSISIQQPVVISSLDPSKPAVENPGDAVILKISEDSVAQPCEKVATMVKFQGVDIQPDLLPILHRVWEKYEDVEGSTIRSCDIKAAALESLAKMIVILQTNNMGSLTDDQANYLASTMSDLQFMQLKVDWLVPFVEKALLLQKQKHLETIMLELSKAKARVEEMKLKFFEHISEVEQELDENIKLVSDSMPISGPIDPEECLGEGLC